jgi:hypothetical protein
VTPLLGYSFLLRDGAKHSVDKGHKCDYTHCQSYSSGDRPLISDGQISRNNESYENDRANRGSEGYGIPLVLNRKSPANLGSWLTIHELCSDLSWESCPDGGCRMCVLGKLEQVQQVLAVEEFLVLAEFLSRQVSVFPLFQCLDCLCVRRFRLGVFSFVWQLIFLNGPNKLCGIVQFKLRLSVKGQLK